MGDKIKLYHTGFRIITEPDLKHGRENADFGQGFYLSDDIGFSKRWARERKDYKTVLNLYELDTEGLNIKRLERNDEWFRYIYDNRNFHGDSLKDYDVITGPIANDTIFDTAGILTSGILKAEECLRLLKIGPVYIQTVIKTEKALKSLKHVGYDFIGSDEISSFRSSVKKEEEKYLEEFTMILESIIAP